MRLLLVAATELELAPLVARLTPASHSRPPSGCAAFTHGSHHVDILTTGVGMIATAAWCARVLARQPYDLAVNLGVCGSFDPAYPPGTVVNVMADCIPELGAEDDEQFLTVQQLGLLRARRSPVQRRQAREPGSAAESRDRRAARGERHHREHRPRQRALDCPRGRALSRPTSRPWKARRSCTRVSSPVSASRRCAPCPTWWRSAIARAWKIEEAVAALTTSACA